MLTISKKDFCLALIMGCFLAPTFTYALQGIRAYADDTYVPPQMKFDMLAPAPSPSHSQVRSPNAPENITTKETRAPTMVPIVVPPKKPVITRSHKLISVVEPPQKPTVPRQHITKKTLSQDQNTGSDIGVSKVTAKAKAVDAPAVLAMPLGGGENSIKTSMRDVSKGESSYADLSVAFLPAAVELTPVQKDKFKDIIETYFIERNAQNINIKVYSSTIVSGKSKSAKRTSLVRGMNIRAWLVDLGVPTSKITLNAMGEVFDENLPDRADIKIIF